MGDRVGLPPGPQPVGLVVDDSVAEPAGHVRGSTEDEVDRAGQVAADVHRDVAGRQPPGPVPQRVAAGQVIGGIAFHAADTLMRDDADQQRLAHEVLACACSLP